MLALNDEGNIVRHPVQADEMAHAIVPGYRFAFCKFGQDVLILEVTRGLTISAGITRYQAMTRAEIRLFGLTPEDFAQKLAPYEIINGEYSTTETTCKGCFGPCGRCEKTA